jgi:hypothetical protein
MAIAFQAELISGTKSVRKRVWVQSSFKAASNDLQGTRSSPSWGPHCYGFAAMVQLGRRWPELQFNLLTPDDPQHLTIYANDPKQLVAAMQAANAATRLVCCNRISCVDHRLLAGGEEASAWPV